MNIIRLHKNKIKKIKVYDMSLLLVILSFLTPQILDYVIPNFRTIVYVLRLASLAFFYRQGRVKRPNRNQTDIYMLFIFVIIFAISETLVAIIKMDVLAFRYLIFCVAFLFSLHSAVKKNPDLLITESLFIFGTYNILQFLSVMVFYPKGMIPTANYLNGSATYFLGGKNQAFISMFIFILVFTIGKLKKNKKISKWTYLILAVFIYESVLLDSMASLACLILIGIVCMIISTKVYKYISFALNPRLLLIVAILMFIIFCIFNTISEFSETGFIAELFHRYGRNMSFTGRTRIWIQAIDMFIKSPLIGGSGEYYLLGSTINQAHNAYLDILAKFGLLGIIPYTLIMISVSNIISKMKNEKYLYSLCSVSFFSLMVHCMFEFMDFYFLLFIFFIFISAREVDAPRILSIKN